MFMKLLLHICCGPCSAACIKILRDENIDVTGYWYNPNIQPYTEYLNRLDALKEYSKLINLKVIYNDKFHDRFIILDKKVLYHSGASYKDLGNKCFAITKMEDKEYLEIIIKNIGEDKCTN